MLSIGSLFSGIGGLELGLEWAGLGPVKWQVEKDPFCASILARHWPDAQRLEDVCTVGASVLPDVDVICGGFPCQDLSFAGKGAGLAGERSGLWFEYERIVREMGPRFVVVENVAALRSRGLDVVLGALASLGYDAEWQSIRASDVGAPHRRERVFIVAYAVGGTLQRWRERRVVGGEARAREGNGSQRQRDGDAVGDRGEDSAHADRDRIVESRGNETHKRRRAEYGGQELGDADVSRLEGRRGSEPERANERIAWETGAERERRRSVESRLGRDPHGLSDRMDRWPSRPGEAQAEWEPPRTIDRGSPRTARSHRLRALGNAVVPQVAEVIGRRVMAIFESQQTKGSPQ